MPAEWRSYAAIPLPTSKLAVRKSVKFDYTTAKFFFGVVATLNIYIGVVAEMPSLIYLAAAIALAAAIYLYKHPQAKQALICNAKVKTITVPVMHEIPRRNLGILSLIVCAYFLYMTISQPSEPLIGRISEFVIKRLGLNANILLQVAFSAFSFISGLEMIFERDR